MEDKDIRDIMEELRIIKDMVYRDKEVVDRFVLSKAVRYLSLVFGVLILLVFWGIYLIKVSGLELDDNVVTYSVVLGLVFISLIAGIVKIFSWKVADPNFSPTSFFYRILGVGVLKFFVIIFILIVFFSLYFSLNGLSQYLLPVIGVGIGLLYLVYGVVFYNLELELISYYIILTSAVSTFFIVYRNIEVFLWVGIVFGWGFILFFLLTTVRAKRKGVR
ncbi:MAG: hypothetical protein N2712_05050 [Brevinematales bacterium]|nr:hypothetical protein [Brevinematales bacterium]